MPSVMVLSFLCVLYWLCCMHELHLCAYEVLKSEHDVCNQTYRVQVVDLSRKSSFIEERNALEFKQRELYGNRIKRDPSMLRSLTRVP